MTRAYLSLAAVLVVAVGAVVAIRVASSEEPVPATVHGSPELVLFVVETDAGPRTAVVGPGGALVVPGDVAITIPGQGDATIAEASGLPGRSAATATANLLGVRIPHHVEIGTGAFAAVVDRAGGIEVGGREISGADAVAWLERSDRAVDEVWATTLEAVLRVVSWEPSDVGVSDSPTGVAAALGRARGAPVETLPTEELEGGLLRADPETIRAAVTALWGVPDREVVPIIVLNGSGEPGIGEAVAERVIRGGFRVVVSENASSFDHDTTLIVVPSEDHRGLGERVRDLLGTGDVQVAGPASGIADVTVLVGKDFGV